MESSSDEDDVFIRRIAPKEMVTKNFEQDSSSEDCFFTQTKEMVNIPILKPIEVNNCKLCPRTFYTSKDLWEHQTTDHKPNRKRRNDKIFLCTFCGMSFCRKYNLLRHQRTCSNVGKDAYKCDRCQKMFALKKNLVVHVKHCILANGRGHPCIFSNCTYSFIKVVDLVKHLNTDHDTGNPILITHHKFVNMSEFLQWKEQIEEETLSSFIARRSDKTQHCTWKSYVCQCSGHPKIQRKGFRKPNKKGSVKLGSLCTARMFAKEDHVSKSVSVQYIQAHCHQLLEDNLKFQRMAHSLKEEIISMLASGLTSRAVYEKIVASSLNQQPKENVLKTRRDCVTIRQIKYLEKKLQQSSYHSNNVNSDVRMFSETLTDVEVHENIENMLSKSAWKENCEIVDLCIEEMAQISSILRQSVTNKKTPFYENFLLKLNDMLKEAQELVKTEINEATPTLTPQVPEILTYRPTPNKLQKEKQVYKKKKNKIDEMKLSSMKDNHANERKLNASKQLPDMKVVVTRNSMPTFPLYWDSSIDHDYPVGNSEIEL